MSNFIDDDNIDEYRGGTLQLNNINQYNDNIQRDAVLDSAVRSTGNTSLGVDQPAVLSGYDFVSPAMSDSPTQEISDPNRIIIPQYNVPFGFENASDYFSYRNGMVESAIDECNSTLIFPNQDGEVVGSWLLTEISLWDNEKERLVTLTNKALITIKYDFIALKQMEFRKINLEQIDTIAIGDLVYPPASLVPNRNMKGVRTMWNKGKPLAFAKKWNPFVKDIPMCTFSSHPLFWHKGSTDTSAKKLYDVENFAEKLQETIELLQHPSNEFCKILKAPIVISNYVGITSLIHNKNSLGFFKVRGKFSF